jgi:succinate dehydrogenase / fumarate reductase, cytochrome b subunit
MLERSRPLSPFLHYRWLYTNTLSILHRATGIILTAGYLLLTCWVMAIARGPAEYTHVAGLLSHRIVKVLLALGLVAFAYHLCNGVRHLLWDAGFGLERREARRSAWIVMVAVLLIVTVVGSALYIRSGGVSWPG